MITCAKGLTSGYSPLGAVICRDFLAEPFLDGHRVASPRHHLRRPPGELRGRRSRNLDAVRATRTCSTTCARNEAGFRERLEALRDLPIVGDVRGAGYFLRARARAATSDTRSRFTDEEARGAAARLPRARASSTPGSSAAPTTAATRSSSCRRRSIAGRRRARRDRVDPAHRARPKPWQAARARDGAAARRRRPARGQGRRAPRRDHARRRARAAPRTASPCSSRRARASTRRSPTTSTRPPAPRSSTPPPTCGAAPTSC